MFDNSKLKKELKEFRLKYEDTAQKYEYAQKAIEQYQATLNRVDSVYYNLKTGLGTGADSSEYNNRKPFTVYSFLELETLAACNPIIAKILSTMTTSVFKNEFTIVSDDREYETKFKKLWKKYNLSTLSMDAYSAAMVFGHSFLLIDDGGDPALPFDVEKAKSIKRIQVLNRYFLAADPIERNLNFDPMYYYLVQQPLVNYNLNIDSEARELTKQIEKLAMKKIHYTRLLPFWGSKLHPALFRTNMHFHDTYIRRIQQACQDYQVASGNMATVISKIPFSKLKIKGLARLLTTPEERQKFAQSMSARELARSNNNVSVMDSEEEYDWYSPSLAGIPEILEMLVKNLTLMSDIPHDVLFGEGSTGNTTGRAEKTNFERVIQSEQLTKIEPKIEFFMQLFESIAGLKRPENYSIKFDHSETPTELEESQTFVNTANACNILAQQGYDCSEMILSKYPHIKQDPDFEKMENFIGENDVFTMDIKENSSGRNDKKTK